jgi:hypothetical protein
MPKANRRRREFEPLHADRFYRKAEVVANRYLGYGPTQLDQNIANGEIEPPIALSESGRASGWFGRYLIKKQTELEAKAAAKRDSVAA